MKKCVLFEKKDPDQVKCLSCSWYCSVAPHKVGACGTRLNRNGELYSLVYGRSTGLALDPVEKKPLYHFLPGNRILSFGTPGCNFGCLFCQNAWMSQVTRVRSSELVVRSDEKELTDKINKITIEVAPEEIVEKALETGAAGIAYTYNEPAIFIEYAYDTMVLARKKGLKNVFVSNGYESAEAFDYIREYLDAINIDLKSFSDKFYTETCKARIGPVKENIGRYFRAGIETEVTTLVIPGKNDTGNELSEIAGFIAGISPDIPWHISRFSPGYLMNDVPETSMDSLLSAYKSGREAGLKFIYLGNVNDDAYSDTKCPKCGELLIRRSGYKTGVMKSLTNKGLCSNCMTGIYGVWN